MSDLSTDPQEKVTSTDDTLDDSATQAILDRLDNISTSSVETTDDTTDGTLDLNNEDVETEETKEVVEEKPTEPIVEQKPIDEEKIAETVADKVRAKLTDQLGLTNKEMDDDKPVWEREKRNPASYKEIADYVADITTKNIEAKQAEQARIEAETRAKQEQEETAFRDSLNKEWDSQLEDLESTGKIPKGDEKTRVELFKIMNDVKNTRIAQGKPFTTNLKEIYYEHYLPKQNKEVAGADAPIGTSKKSVTSNNSGYTYNDIRNADPYDLVREAQ